MANVVAIIGTSGGVGTSTVTAHLAAARVVHKKETLAFDFCPDNVLRLHFAMPWADSAGFAPSLLNDGNWYENAYRSAGGIDFVPFGKLQNDAELAQLTSWLAARPDWFKERQDEIELRAETHIICDCPHAYPALREQVLAAASMVLIVMQPDSLSYARAAQIAQASATAGGPPVGILLNGFNPARSLDRDILALLRTNLNEHLAPVHIHQDESLREAFACKQTVFEFAPSSQSAYEFQALTIWLAARISKMRKHA
jgi:cellulose synthase operon protein YhjQ